MWPLMQRCITCLTESRSVYCSLFWVLSVLFFLGLYVGWLNLSSVARLLARINWERKEDSMNESKTDRLSGSKSSLLSTALLLYQDLPNPHPITTRLTLGFFCFSLILAALTLVRATSPWPVYEYSNVRVISQVSDNSWFMQKEDGRFLAIFCNDYTPTLEPDTTLTKLRYEDRGTCWSVARKDLGYWKKRDADGNLVLGENQ
jgi:hypothetical protein